MNGWQRLFVMFVLVVAVAAFAIWVSQKPGDYRYVSDCSEPNRVTQAEAAAAIASNNFRENPWNVEPKCLRELEQVASGRESRKKHDVWRSDLKGGAIALTIFFAVIYCLGWALGWVWRGFFPKKAESSR